MTIEQQIAEQNNDLAYALWLEQNKKFLTRFILENLNMSVSLTNERWISSNELTVEVNAEINGEYCQTCSDSVSLEKE